MASVFVGCLLGMIFTPHFSVDDKLDAKQLEGNWLPAMAELSGEPFKDEQLRKMKLSIKGDKYTAFVGDVKDEGSIKIDGKAKPKTMDIIGGDGPNKGKAFPCIYELKDDTLRICYDLSGKQRPKEFKTGKEGLLFLVTYKRDKR